MDKVFLCLDFGTESVRGELIDISGITHASKSVKYHTFFGPNGIVEQNPKELYESMLQVCRSLSEKAQERALKVEAICVDTTASSLVFLDKDFYPLNNLMLWMDVRAEEILSKNENINENLLSYHKGANTQATWMPLRMKWIKENKPEVYHNTAYVCELLNWIEYRLTGNLVTGKNVATLKWYFNSSAEGGWPLKLYEALGIEEVIEKIPPQIVATGQTVGTLKRDFAEKLGFSRDIKIIEGGADAFIGMIGLNSVVDGNIALIGGSSHVMLCHTKEKINVKGLYGSFPDALIEGLNILEGSQTASGATLKWYVENFIESDSRDYSLLDDLASKIEVGSNGLIVLDHWQGNRSPFMDSNSRGVIQGLTLSHTPIHLYRAIIEGVSLGTAIIFDRLNDCGYKVQNFTIGGGVAKSDFWVSVHADSLGIPVRKAKIDNAPLLGCAMVAAYGCGYYSSITLASNNMAPIFEFIQPDLSNNDKYLAMKEKYIEIYKSINT